MGRLPKELQREDPPEEFLYLFGHYCDLQGEGPLTYSEIESWNNLTGINISPLEVSIIRQLDNDFWKIANERNSNPSNPSKK